jgi:hypothetical protein
MRDQPGFFDFDERLKRLSDLGDQLETWMLLITSPFWCISDSLALESEGESGCGISLDFSILTSG